MELRGCASNCAVLYPRVLGLYRLADCSTLWISKVLIDWSFDPHCIGANVSPYYVPRRPRAYKLVLVLT